MALPALAELRLELETCCACGIEFAMPTALRARRLQDHKDFYCPSGHGQHYTAKSDLEKAREEADQLRRRLEFANNEARAQRDLVERQRRRVSAAKGRVTRLKNRAAKGQCPCCGKTFADLREHMSARHPGYAEKES